MMTDDSPSQDNTFNSPSFPTISDYDGVEQNLDLSYVTLEDLSFYFTGFKFKIAAEDKS